jgi:hypothetical protein
VILYYNEITMAYDENIAARIRSLIGFQPGLTEKKMFGGLAFLLNGNMVIAASGEGGILARVNPDDTNDLLSSSHAKVMIMRGKTMSGWLRINTEDVVEDAELQRWVDLSLNYAKTLAPKR